MLEILASPDAVAAFAISGTLTGDDYDRIIAEVEAKLGRPDRIAAAIADPILPHVEVRVFDPGDLAEAMRWVSAF